MWAFEFQPFLAHNILILSALPQRTKSTPV